MSPIWEFTILIFSIVIWNVNTYFIFRRLKVEHPDKYSELGEPAFGKIDKSIWLYFKFIFFRGWTDLSDPKLSRICYLMPFLLLLVLIGIFTLQNSISVNVK